MMNFFLNFRILLALPPLLLSSQFACSLFAQTIVPTSEPTAYFNAVFFDSGGSENFVYAPWGNALETNSTIFKIRVGSYRMSKKFSYYGNSPLKLYISKQDLADLDAPPKLISVVEHAFKTSNSGTVEEVLLLKKTKDGTIQSFGLPFGKFKIPQGNFLFQSFAKEMTYFKVGENKFSLPGGKSKLVQPGSNVKDLSINGYLKRKGKFKDALIQNISNSKTKRGILALNVSGNMIKPLSLIEKIIKEESVLGYGSNRTTNPLQRSDDQNVTKPSRF
jgi:hypothetical protein